MKMVQVLGETAMLEIKRKVQEVYDDEDESGEFERRMKEDPEFALRHQDDLRTLKLLSRGFK